MRITPPIEDKIRRTIRDARSRDPLITVVAVQEELQRKFNRTFDRAYLAKLCNKVAVASRIELDRTQIEQRMSFTRENYRMMREELLKIVYWDPETATAGVPKPLAKDRIEAAKNVVMMDLALLSAEIANGMYKKPVEAIAREFRYDPLPDEIRTVVIASWQRGGLLPKAMVEKMIPNISVPCETAGGSNGAT
jgi:hypothetical protein